MRCRILCWYLAMGWLLLTAIRGQSAEPTANEFRLKPVGFVKLPTTITLQAVSAVALDAQDRLYILQRGTPPLLAFDAAGDYTHGWGDKLFKQPHGLRIDAVGNLWTTDNTLHQLCVFSPRGELLNKLSTWTGPDGKPDKFKAPDDLVFDRDGNLYVADSGNGRIVKLDPRGKFLAAWGKKGKADGQFATAHSLAIDEQQQIYVGDRGNQRIQVFDREGKHLASYAGFGNPFGLAIRRGTIFASEGDKHQLVQLNAQGAVTGVWGDAEKLQLPHLMAWDSQGRLYVAEVNGKRVQIFMGE